MNGPFLIGIFYRYVPVSELFAKKRAEIKNKFTHAYDIRVYLRLCA